MAFATAVNFCNSCTTGDVGTSKSLFTIYLYGLLVRWLILVLFPLTVAAIESHKILVPGRMAYPTNSAPDTRPLYSWPSYAASLRIIKKDGEKVIYDTQMNHNSFGFRTYNLPTTKNPKQHLIMAGCSLTYGEGLNDPDTFVYKLTEKYHDRLVVNMGRRGASPQDHLYLWRYLNWKEVYAPEEGVMVYTIFADHLERIVRTWRYLSWVRPFNVVFKNDGNHWILDGIVNDKFSFKLAKFMKTIGLEIYWLRATHHFNPLILEGSEQMMADILLEVKKEYLRQYPKGRFVVSWFSHMDITIDQTQRQPFLEALNKHGIEYWDNPKDHERTTRNGGIQAYEIPGDGHPTPLANQEYFEFLAKKLN